MSQNKLRKIVSELLLRDPGSFQDYVLGYNPLVLEPSQPSPQSKSGSPPWCKCGNCRPMRLPVEDKCCATVRDARCVASTGLFRQLVLNGNVLRLAIATRNDIGAYDEGGENKSMRHAAYRQFILWRHGRLGHGNRRVVPSCCVLSIRASYPSASGQYKGYIER